MLQEWKNAQDDSEGQQTECSLSGTMNNTWAKPPAGWVKINNHATIFEETRSVGLGCVARGDTCEFLRAHTCNCRGLFTPREAEALSMKEAICWVLGKGFKRCIIEADAKLVIDAIQGSGGRISFHMIITDCVHFLKHFNDVIVCHVRRYAYGVAHLLAKAGHSISDLLQ